MAKKVPNPYGKKGSPKHQKRVKELINEYAASGFQIQTEYYVKIANGLKKSRFVDIVVLAGESLLYFVQVCRMNKDGKTPVKRERDAASDLSSVYPDIPIRFEDYQYEGKDHNRKSDGKAG